MAGGSVNTEGARQRQRGLDQTNDEVQRLAERAAQLQSQAEAQARADEIEEQAATSLGLLTQYYSDMMKNPNWYVEGLTPAISELNRFVHRNQQHPTQASAEISDLLGEDGRLEVARRMERLRGILQRVIKEIKDEDVLDAFAEKLGHHVDLEDVAGEKRSDIIFVRDFHRLATEMGRTDVNSAFIIDHIQSIRDQGYTILLERPQGWKAHLEGGIRNTAYALLFAALGAIGTASWMNRTPDAAADNQTDTSAEINGTIGSTTPEDGITWGYTGVTGGGDATHQAVQNELKSRIEYSNVTKDNYWSYLYQELNESSDTIVNRVSRDLVDFRAKVVSDGVKAIVCPEGECQVELENLYSAGNVEASIVYGPDQVTLEMLSNGKRVALFILDKSATRARLKLPKKNG